MAVDHGFQRREPEYKCPMTFEKMKELAKTFSAEIPFVRVDFYEIKGKAILGEFTFYDWGGMQPFGGNWDSVLGEWIILPSK